MPFVDAGKVRLHYEEFGAGEEVLVFVHGYSGAWTRYRPVIDRLPLDRFRIIAVDLRGAGESDKPESGYGMADFSDDIGGLARTLGLPRFILVGHSMGGAVAYQFAIDHQEMLRAVMFVTPAPADGIEAPTEEMFAEQARRKADRAYSLEVERRKTFYRPVPPDMAEQSAESLDNSSEAFLRESWWAMTGLRLGDRLASINVPALMVGADHDESVPLVDIMPDYHRIPNCGLYVFSRCNHWPTLEAPDEFAALVVDFADAVA